MVRPGETVGSIRHGGGQLVEIDIAEGIAPAASTLTAPDAKAFVATDSMGNAEVAIGLEDIHDGHATIGIESVTGRGLDVILTQKLVIDAMARAEVKHATISPQVASIPKEALPQIGFLPDGAGEDYTLSLAA
ncbi:MAG TPA: hypothetical protein VHA05_02030 [Candidatus Saccharimonadales bacterium]|nr:hypothetical protein [Candidatus Saccharimonadales bacterium]